jgi:D-tyrosyl-tRNA(Tyr) deacylase
MRVLLQRSGAARVDIEGRTVGRIDRGLVVLIGMGAGDTEKMLRPAAEKIVNLRIFGDDTGNMNRSLLDVGGGLLVVSQFTLYADAKKGRRPSFIGSLPPAEARDLYEKFLGVLRESFPGGHVACGEFGAMMEVHLVNDGPVTIWLDSAEMNW